VAMYMVWSCPATTTGATAANRARETFAVRRHWPVTGLVSLFRDSNTVVAAYLWYTNFQHWCIESFSAGLLSLFRDSNTVVAAYLWYTNFQHWCIESFSARQAT
jgi:hypothetical protein